MEKKGSIGLSLIVLGVLSLILIAAYFFLPELKIWVLVLLILVVAAIIVLLAFHHFGPSRKLEKKLVQLEQEMQQGSTIAKDLYLEAYHLYRKVSESAKRKLYPRLSSVRKNMEGQWQAEKQIQMLIPKAEKADFEEKKEIFRQMNGFYSQLPLSAQGKYKPYLTHLIEQLENGK
ncbi:hypothetical protein COV20_06340 [Candidatus Woesearchaeota archaeon CG10_big_fil_rev_8_21_14_0_10_45_16]|nr:MAG: hypothetical protein COV20_06340 [Candidatus Woesearchaeota archaeon CG10_big_fil_rev_8_21_14_0_10_45_16]